MKIMKKLSDLTAKEVRDLLRRELRQTCFHEHAPINQRKIKA